MLSDERLEELTESVKDEAKSWDFDPQTVKHADGDYVETHKHYVSLIADHIAALEELRALRRRDAAIEKAFDDPNYELWISRGKRFEITLYDTAGEREREIYADTFSAALSVLAAGLEGGSDV